MNRHAVLRLVAASITTLVAACQAQASAQIPPTASGQPLSEGLCVVTGIHRLAEGGDQDWSHANGLIAFDLRDGGGVYQLYTMQSDGSADECLTCSPRPGSPRVDRHKVNPTWHSTGRYIVLQGEMDTHPLSWLRENVTSELFINGLWSNLYAVTADGQRWYRLTDYSSSQADGALGPHFSADGSKLLWSRMIAPASGEAPFGVWRLQIADFVLDDTGTPSLQNTRDITPTGGTFVEAHGFSPDGRRALVTGDIENQNQWGMDLYTVDLDSGAVTNLTNSPYWEEHGSYSPSGRKLAYMSSEPYAASFLKTELLLLDVESGSRHQLTHFNRAGYPEYTEEQSVAARPTWSPDGTQLALTQMLSGRNLWKRHLWVVSFAGPCGTL